MTGAFIIEGKYDDELDAFYGTGWTRKQPIIEIEELGGSTKLFKGGGKIGGTYAFVVNGRPQPAITMKSGEVQLWRFINSAARSGAYLPAPGKGVAWKQIAQDGVQFSPANYWNNTNEPLLLMAGNRADLLVKAPVIDPKSPAPVKIDITASKVVNDAEIYGPGANPQAVLLSIMVVPEAAIGPQTQFVPQAQAPTLPAFLQDIKASDVKGTKKLVFESVDRLPTDVPPPLAKGPPFTRQLIDGKEFDGDVGEVVLMNNVEEWTIVNKTAVAPTGPINYPFHIHINPFQVVEVFDPNEPLRDASGNVVRDSATNPVPLYNVTATPPAADQLKPNSKRELTNGQCWVDPGDESTWRPCGKPGGSGFIWWDVFPIPAGLVVPNSNPAVVIPGYFKMRSRFVDYNGFYVLHCHILAHEDRGMMTVVEVVPTKTIYAHH
jgi:FtsP/CotA-like multicopper oxidase with cupredoxin domain